MDPADFAVLYRDAASVRRLAAALVGETAADDVWQEVWRKLLGRSLLPEHAGAYLRTLVRRKALQFRRGEFRRHRREALAAREERLPSSEELVTRTEAHRNVVDAVLGLEEPYRRTVLLIFFEGLESTDIARREGIPLETVRTRKKRALAQLRERLERLHDEPADWLRGMALLAGLERGAVQASRTFQPLVFGLSTVLALSLSLVWFLSREPGTEDPGLSGSEAILPVSLVRAGETPDSSRTRKPLEAEARAAPASAADLVFRLGGRLLDPHGAPVAGGALRAWVAGLHSSEPPLDGASDAHGRFELVLPAVAPLWARSRSLVVEAWAPGLRSQRLELELATLTESLETDLQLTPGFTLEGRVKDRRGEPVAGAMVFARFDAPSGLPGVEMSEADARGEYRLGLPLGAQVTGIESWMAEVGSDRLELSEVPLGERAEDLVLAEDTVLSGSVTYPDGSPASEVLLRDTLLRVDAEGRFFRAPTAAGPKEAGMLRVARRLQFRPERAIEDRLVEKATLRSGSPTAAFAVSDEQGRFEFHGRPAGAHVVTLATALPHAETGRGIAPELVVRAGESEAHIVVERHRVVLEVVDEASVALSDVEVAYTPLAPSSEGGFRPAREPERRFTSATGRVGFGTDPWQPAALTAILPDRAVELVLTVPERPYEIREQIRLSALPPRGAVRLLARDGAPIAGALLSLSTDVARVPLPPAWTSGADGVMAGLPAGTYRAECRRSPSDPWGLPVEFRLTVSEGETLDVELETREGGQLSVLFEPRVEDPEARVRTMRARPTDALIFGQERAPATLRRAEEPAGAPPFLVLRDACPGERWTSDEPLPPGRYSLDVRFEFFEPVQVWVLLEPGRKSEIVVPLEPLASFQR